MFVFKLQFKKKINKTNVIYKINWCLGSYIEHAEQYLQTIINNTYKLLIKNKTWVCE